MVHDVVPQKVYFVSPVIQATMRIDNMLANATISELAMIENKFDEFCARATTSTQVGSQTPDHPKSARTCPETRGRYVIILQRDRPPLPVLVQSRYEMSPDQPLEYRNSSG